MAQRGSLILAISLLVACGGHVTDGSNSDSGAHVDGGVDASPFASGWTSYTMHITSSARLWSSSPPSPPPPDPTSGWSGRVDFDPGTGAGGTAHVVMLPAFTDGKALDAASGTTTTFVSAKDDALLAVSAFGGFQNVSDRYDTFAVQVSSDGSPYAATLSGTTMASSGDVAWQGTVTATVTFDRDRVGPSWRWTGATSFAPVTLPWDERTIESSEPYEETLGIDQLIAEPLSADAARIVPISANAHGTTKERGAILTLLDWDRSEGLSAREPFVHDFASNATVATHPSTKIPGITVARRDTPTWAPDDGGPAAYTWGAASVVEADCASCPAEMVLGPVHAIGCQPGSEAGLAVRLPASGPYFLRLRAHVVPPPMPSPGSPPGVNEFLHVQLVNPYPGKAKVDVDLSALKWSAPPGSDGSYDTGFVDVFASPGGAFSETGIAISAGGLGTTNTCGFGGPLVPATWGATVTVEHIVEVPPP